MTSSKIFLKLNIFFFLLCFMYFFWIISSGISGYILLWVPSYCVYIISNNKPPYHYFIHLQFPITSYSTISSIVGFLLLLNEIFTDTFWGMLVCLLAYAGCSIIQPLGLLWQPQITGLNSAEERHVSTIYIFDKLLLFY